MVRVISALFLGLAAPTAARLVLLRGGGANASAESGDDAVTDEDVMWMATAANIPKIENWKPYPWDGPKEEPKPKPTVAPLPRAPTAAESPKCDQVCTNGDERARAVCMIRCDRLREKTCTPSFNCHVECNNHIKRVRKDEECEALCDRVTDHICEPFVYAAPSDMVSPHHNDKPPPSAEFTPKPRVTLGKFFLCNLYPASYKFEVFKAFKEGDTKGEPLTTLAYEECAQVEMMTLQAVGVRVEGKFIALSLPLYKIPSVMVFGQDSWQDPSVVFQQYFAKGAGAYVCNGFPLMESKEEALPVQILREGYQGKRIASLAYRECVPTGLKHGDVVAASVLGKDAGIYYVKGSPAAIVLGKAGATTAIAFEAWR